MPITDLALQMLEQIKKEGEKRFHLLFYKE